MQLFFLQLWIFPPRYLFWHPTPFSRWWIQQRTDLFSNKVGFWHGTTTRGDDISAVCFRGLPYMTSARFSDFSTPPPLVTVTNLLILFRSSAFWGHPSPHPLRTSYIRRSPYMQLLKRIIDSPLHQMYFFYIYRCGVHRTKRNEWCTEKTVQNS